MKLVLLGERATGKTSYVVGIYGGLANEVYDELQLKTVLGTVHLLNDDFERLARRESVERSASEGVDEFGLRVEYGGTEHTLQIPDRSGEALQLTLNGREWEASLLEDLREADGLLFFVNPMMVRPGEGASAAEALLPLQGDQGDEIPRAWTPEMMPTDVRMVDALQELRDLSRGGRVPVAVIISAWDEVADLGKTPREWLEDRLPLVAQFLDSNDASYPARCFGVSAQGGAFVEGQEVPPDEPDPWDRAYALDDDGTPISLVEPLSWLLTLGPPE